MASAWRSKDRDNGYRKDYCSDKELHGGVSRGQRARKSARCIVNTTPFGIPGRGANNTRPDAASQKLRAMPRLFGMSEARKLLKENRKQSDMSGNWKLGRLWFRYSVEEISEMRLLDSRHRQAGAPKASWTP